MGLSVAQLREYIVRPALQDLGMHSDAAENLVIGTGAQESDGFRAVRQYDNGPAMGLFQVEPATFYDYWDNYLLLRPSLAKRIIDLNHISEKGLFDERPHPERCIHDIRFAAMMCRIHYRRIRAPLPDAHDVWGLAAYWKKYYNTVHGAGTEDEFVANYPRA